MKDLSRNVTLFCDVCGNDQFSSLDNHISDLENASDETKIQCSVCKKIFTKAELIEVNEEVINLNIEEIQNEAIDEFEKEMKKIFKKWR